MTRRHHVLSTPRKTIGGVTCQAEGGIPRNPGAGTCQSKVFVIMSSLMTPCWESRQVERVRLVSDAAGS